MGVELTGDDLLTLNRMALVARLLAGTAHDVNNALQIIGGSAELLGQSPAGTGASQRAVERVRGQSARAAAAIDALMEFARVSGVASSRVSLKNVVTTSLALRAYALRRAGLVPAFDVATAPAAVVIGHVTRLQQAVLNLIVNAEQALRGRADAALAIELREEAGEARLTIKDNGPGLDPSIAERAFEPFVTTRPTSDATGLGLPSARLVARQHGGEVELRSTPEGCAATLRAPLAP
jgi:signal transduction histidine kinase